MPAALFPVPRLPATVIPRPALQQHLRDAAALGSAWVCGPAGAGKSTAVAQWLRSTRRNTRWLRLDAADNDPGVLLPRLQDALSGTAGEGAAPGLAYGPEHRHDLTRLARPLFRSVLARLRKPLVWVLDAVEAVDDDLIETVLDAVIDQAPPTLTLVVISRREPGPRLARHIARQHLGVVRRDALRFNLAETAALFDKRRLKLPAEQLARCCNGLDGWAVGLVFASNALLQTGSGAPALATPAAPAPSASRPGAAPQASGQGADPCAALDKALSSALAAPDLMNYLAGDVVERWPAAQQALLLATAYLPRFTAAQAARLSGLAAAPELIEQLQRDSGFVEAEPAKETHYRVHPVLRVFLQRQEARALALCGHTGHTLRQQSAQLLRQAGQLAEAAALYLQDARFDTLADMVEQHAPQLLRWGRDHTLAELVQAIPAQADILKTRPWLHFWRGEALALAAPAQARDAARHALQAFDAQPGADAWLGRVLAAGTLLNLHRAARLDVAAPRQLAELCEAQFLQHWQAVPPALAMHAAAAYLSAVSTLHHGSPLPPAVWAWLLQALQNDGPADLRLRVARTLHEQAYIRNDHAVARAVEQVAQAICAQAEARASARCQWLVGLAVGHVYQRRLAEAEAVLDQAAPLAQAVGDLASRCLVNAWRMVVLARLRRPHDALGLVLSNEPGLVQVPPLMRSTLWWAEGNLFMALRQYETALGRFEAAVALYHETGTNIEQGPMLWLGQSLCLLMLRRPQAALAALAPLSAATMAGASGERLRAFMLAIQASVACGGPDAGADPHADTHANPHTSAHTDTPLTPAARACLQQAFSALRRTDYRDVMWGAEPGLASLCAAALEHQVEPDYAATLIRSRQLEAPAHAPVAWPYPVRLACLGDLRVESAAADAPTRALRTSSELLQHVLAAWPQPQPIDPLLPLLWPGQEREGAQKAFDAALHRLRKRLGHDSALRLSDRCLSLNPGLVQVDLQQLQALLEATATPTPTGDAALALQLEGLYRGHLLPALHSPQVATRRAALWQQVRALLLHGAQAAQQPGTGDPRLARRLLARVAALDASCTLAVD